MDCYLGMIFLWGAPWIPAGFMPCDGRSLNIQQYAALYAVMGIRYGGNGTSTFNLPDLRGKFPLGLTTPNQNPVSGGSATLATTAQGIAQASIGVANLPAHAHTYSTAPSGTVSIAIPVSTSAPADTVAPGPTTILGAANYSDGFSTTNVSVYSTDTAGAGVTTLAPFNVTISGSGTTANTGNTGLGTPLNFGVTLPVSGSIMPPYCPVNYMICTEGLFPPRN